MIGKTGEVHSSLRVELWLSDLEQYAVLHGAQEGGLIGGLAMSGFGVSGEESTTRMSGFGVSGEERFGKPEVEF